MASDSKTVAVADIAELWLGDCSQSDPCDHDHSVVTLKDGRVFEAQLDGVQIYYIEKHLGREMPHAIHQSKPPVTDLDTTTWKLRSADDVARLRNRNYDAIAECFEEEIAEHEQRIGHIKTALAVHERLLTNNKTALECREKDLAATKRAYAAALAESDADI